MTQKPETLYRLIKCKSKIEQPNNLVNCIGLFEPVTVPVGEFYQRVASGVSDEDLFKVHPTEQVYFKKVTHVFPSQVDSQYMVRLSEKNVQIEELQKKVAELTLKNNAQGWYIVCGERENKSQKETIESQKQEIERLKSELESKTKWAHEYHGVATSLENQLEEAKMAITSQHKTILFKHPEELRKANDRADKYCGIVSGLREILDVPEGSDYLEALEQRLELKTEVALEWERKYKEAKKGVVVWKEQVGSDSVTIYPAPVKGYIQVFFKGYSCTLKEPAPQPRTVEDEANEAWKSYSKDHPNLDYLVEEHVFKAGFKAAKSQEPKGEK